MKEYMLPFVFHLVVQWFPRDFLLTVNCKTPSIFTEGCRTVDYTPGDGITHEIKSTVLTHHELRFLFIF